MSTPFSSPPPGSPVQARPLPQHLHEFRLSLHLRAVLETPERTRLPARQTLSGLAPLLDDMRQMIVGQVGGNDVEQVPVVGRWVVGLQFRGQYAADGGLQ